MTIPFSKYQGTGNDFVIIDNRELDLSHDDQLLFSRLCHRKFGIGADGIILIQDHSELDFEMVYFNADGKTGSMCGNGARCAVRFADQNGLILNGLTKFLACDGMHKAEINEDQISIQMKDVGEVEVNVDYFFLDTGSPHYVEFMKGVDEVNVLEEGRMIRNNDRFKEKGTNVNFAEDFDDHIYVRTYERGVENETLSCGTGVVAVALSAYVKGILTDQICNIKTKGGHLSIRFEPGQNKFKNIYLQGPALHVYNGVIN